MARVILTLETLEDRVVPTTLPVANPDTFDVFNAETLVRSAWEGVLANDTFGASSYLTVTEVNGQSTNVGTPVVLASGGTLQLQADGAFTYTPASNFVGVDSFTYTISDGTNIATTTVDIAGIVITLAPIADQELFEGDAVSLQVSASASSGPGLTFSYYSGNLPNGLSLDPVTGLITGTIAHGTTGTFQSAVYTMVENQTLMVQREFTWTVAPLEITVDEIPTQVAGEGDAVSLQLGASVSHGPALDYTWYADNLPNGLVLDPYTGLISGTLTHDSAGTLTTNVYAMLSNGSMAMGYGVISWTIVDMPEAFTIATIADQQHTEGDTVSLQVSASVPGSEMVTYSAYNLPDGLSIDATTGIISGTLMALAVNTGYPNTVTVLASTANYVAMQSFLWNVAAQVPAAPVVLSWVGAANGGNGTDWTDPKNWTGNRVPGVGDHVSIANVVGLGLINVQNNVEVATLYLDAGVSGLTGAGNLTIRQGFEWVSGQISGTGTLTLAGNTVLSSAGTVLLGRATTNQAKFVWQQGDMRLNAGAILTNAGMMEIKNDGVVDDVNGTGTERIINSGHFIKTMGAGAGRTDIEVAFNHVGPTFLVNQGNVRFRRDGFHTRTFTSMLGTSIEFRSGIHTLNNGVVFAGAGQYTVRFATLKILTGVTVLNNSNFTLTASGKIEGSGTTAGAGVFLNNLKFTWEAGKLQFVIFRNLGTLTVDQGGPLALDSSLLENFTSFKWATGTIVFESNLDAATIRNFGTWEAQDDSEIEKTNGVFAQSIVNEIDMQTGKKAIFTKTGGLPGGKTRIEVLFTNNGDVNYNNRTIDFAGNPNP